MISAQKIDYSTQDFLLIAILVLLLLESGLYISFVTLDVELGTIMLIVCVSICLVIIIMIILILCFTITTFFTEVIENLVD